MRLASALLFSSLIVLASLALAGDDGYWRGDYLTREQYENRYAVVRPGPDDMAEIKVCLDAWHNNPFGYSSNLTARIITAKVKVLGIGENINDNARTDYPQLIYIKPSVNVLSKTAMYLLNPNGWYCLKTNVTVLSEIKVEAHCRAHIASSRSDVTVLGSTSGERSSPGVTVLGKVIVENAECD
jgi:hypothetical protein